jgi:hypothetical protein
MTEEDKIMKLFPCRQAELEQKITEWQALAPNLIRIDYVESYSGHKVYGVTITDDTVPDSSKRAHYFAQPHAHEPGTSAGMIDVIEQLITGKDLQGNPSAIDREAALSKLILSFNPIGNPQGREKAPVDCWDGSYCDNERFWCWMRGEDPDNPGKMWKRLNVWDPRDYNTPDPIGIVYEQIGEFRYAEPNRTLESSYFKLFHKLDAQYHYEAWFDLHQCEHFGKPEQNCSILLAGKAYCNPEKEPENVAWALDVIAAWQKAGLTPDPKPIPLSYTGEQLEYFKKNWSPLHARMNILNTEVKNNSPEMTPQIQLKAQAIAIEISIKRLLLCKQCKTSD